ncbi:hypothetical protein OR16_04342 [Cupriavidus basilensis OR16]|uniref:Uncharacterized protein n=1 Tax=Cupriavidus basilensis OR16 TaxID=1127483 RepID=H1RZW2_9BURK|nr:hypothetical protein [Cupriavidus basilensis]EHP44178.1 hypothetical protein OR16_04342 [Cupriavidus basilensis OR16]
MLPELLNIDGRIQAVLTSATTSHWLRQALIKALQRDCVDAARDAHLLAELLNQRCDSLLGKP